MWLKAEGFVGLVKQWWDSYLFQALPSFFFARRLEALKLYLKKMEWGGVWQCCKEQEDSCGRSSGFWCSGRRKGLGWGRAIVEGRGYQRIREIYSYGGGELEAKIYDFVVKGRR
jgi:hypothetical protein